MEGNMSGESLARKDGALLPSESEASLCSLYTSDSYDNDLVNSPTSTVLISDNASDHSIGWESDICRPLLDDHNPLEHFLPRLLQEMALEPSDLEIVDDNPSSIVRYLEETSRAVAETDFHDSMSTPLSPTFKSTASKRSQHMEELLPKNGSSGNHHDDQAQTILPLVDLHDSCASIDVSKQGVPNPPKYGSPASVMDTIDRKQVLTESLPGDADEHYLILSP